MDNKPSIQGVTGNLSGAVYAGALADGSAGAFLYGAASTYDAQRNLDGRFGVNYEPAFPSAGIAVYKFSSLLLDGPAQFRANNRFDVALIGAGGVSNSLLAPSFTMDTSALHSLFIGTENGGLSLSAASISATANSTFRFLQLYGRGSGSMSIDSTLSLPTANLFVDAPGNLSFGGGSSVTVDKAVINAGGTINANGFITANTLQFYSETAVQMKKKLGNIGVLNVFAPRFSTTAPIAVNGGVLDIGTGGIDAKDLSLTGFDSISTQGSIDSGNLLARGNISAGGSINIDPSAPATISATNIVAGGGIESSGDAGTLFPFAGPEAGGTVTIDAAQVVFDSAAINGANLDGGDVGLSLATDGGNGGTLNVGTAAKPIAGKVWIGARISATTGANASTTLTGGNGGTVNVEAADSIAVTSTVKVSGSAYVNDAAGNPTTARTGRGSSRGGNISLHSTKTTGTAISVQSSAQLLSLLSAAAPGPGGTIKFVAEGGDISVDNGNSTSGSTTSTGKIRADKGTVDIHNNGADGRVLVNNANIRGDVVKIGALGANGQLIIGGGTISADTSLKLYGGTSNGQVRFVDNVTLGGESTKIIAGKTVQIDSNKTVTVGGSAAAQVFTDKANYTGSGGNGSTTGKFGGAGATTQGLTGRPSF